MEMETNDGTHIKKDSDLNGNNNLYGTQINDLREVSTGIKDQIFTSDGRVFYPCRYCNKLFSIKKTRTAHIKSCAAKEYILSVDDTPNDRNQSKESFLQNNIPEVKKTQTKIDIHQNIVLNEQMNVSEILSKTNVNVRQSPINGHNTLNNLTNNSLILKEKNECHDDFNSVAKRLESNAVTLTKQKKSENQKDFSPSPSVGSDQSDDQSSEFSCRECNEEFDSELELLRHSRKSHSYPKVMMALSEVKKFYAVKNRSECPICHKPLKTSFRSAFVKHLHTHTNEMKFSCKVCNRMFRRSDHMRAHEKRHIIKDKK